MKKGRGDKGKDESKIGNWESFKINFYQGTRS
jgi:hypothetical protein